MVAIMEVSEDMAGKIRKALAEAAPYVSTPEFVEAAQFLDRLSPPEPEQPDEATVWTRKVLSNWTLGDYRSKIASGECDQNSDFQLVRAVIAELIASKDVEISKAGNHYARIASKAVEELATLRAENERLKPAILVGVGKIDGDGWKDVTREGQIVYVWNDEKPHPYAPGQYSRIGCEGWSASTDQFDFRPATIREAREAFDCVRKAAERNTAEPATEMMSIYDSNYTCPCGAKVGELHKADCAEMLASQASEPTEDAIIHGAMMSDVEVKGAFGKVHTDGLRSGGMPPGTNAGAVEVTEWGDHEKRVEAIWKEQRIAFVTQVAGLGDDPSPKAILAKALTEAEARGRREALEEARKRVWERLYPENPKSDWTKYARDRADAAEAADDELKRMIAGEK